MSYRSEKIKHWYEGKITRAGNAVREGGLRSVPSLISKHNQKRNAHVPATRSYIGQQGGGGAADGLRFGLFSMAFNGCEVIAVYNLLKYLGRFRDIREIAADFEKQGAIVMGGFGTRPSALYHYIRNHAGRPSELYIFRPEKKDPEEPDYAKILAGARAAVLTFWNGHNSWTIHTVMIAPLKNGKIRVFNRYPDRLFHDYPSVEAMLAAPIDPLKAVSMIVVR